MFKTAEAFVARLNEVEKSTIREAKTNERLDWIFQNKHKYEFLLSPTKALNTFLEAVALINAHYATASQYNGFGNTWKF